MKVLRVISSINPTSGGPGQGIRNMIPALEQLGIANEVVCLDDTKANFITKSPFTIHALGEANNPWSYHPQLLPWLREHLLRFDAVIVHGLWLYHGFAVYKALKVLQKEGKQIPKMYVMPHGMLDPWFQRAEGRKLKAIRNWVYWKLVEQKVIHAADGILFTCEEELRLAKETFRPYAPRRELNVGYGIQPPPPRSKEMETAFYQQCPQIQYSPYLLFLSRIHVKKGVDLLIKAYLQLKKEGLALPKLVVAGPGLETTYGKEMVQLASVDKDIVFPGMLSGDAKWGAFYGCEAFVLPSHQENFGIAVVEALACGKIVLISNQVNIWREIDAGKAGIVEPDTQEGVVNLLKKWYKAEKVGLDEKAETAFKQYFSVSEAATKLQQLFMKILI
ncbi:glycosyltransferase [Runella sp. MFBS21]|uniref:glycosyltransferase n=1 Tax=Runella sp. MFBS21 TaxID=3034018 RepID=UPI0023FA1C63|nr:glycosyltransferase [Runella sp. MFBS21]MDF7820406.1 glycosyltransferase [Runella sp. MFBS21]